jgi:hypothetical protein
MADTRYCSGLDTHGIGADTMNLMMLMMTMEIVNGVSALRLTFGPKRNQACSWRL